MSLWRTGLAPGLFTVLTAFSGLATPPVPIVFERIGLRSGLSQGSIRCMFQDNRGFLWFGTQDGLNRYDGHNFTAYRHSSDDPQSLPNNSIAAIAEDTQGVLWVATTGGGLAAFDRATEHFTRHQHDPKNPASLSDNATSFVFQDSRGRLWVGTQFGGINLFDSATGTFRHYRHDSSNSDSLASDDITYMLEDRSKALWVATRNAGLDRFDPDTGRFTHYRHNDARPDSLNHDTVNVLYEDAQGRFWAGTERGAAILDRNTGKFIRYEHNRRQRTASTVEPVIGAIWLDTEGDLWIGTQTGLERVDRQGRKSYYLYDPVDERTPSSNGFRSVLQDRSGTLWFGTTHGINKVSAANRRFATFHAGQRKGSDGVRALFEDSAGLVWVGTDVGLNRYDPDTGESLLYSHKEGDPGSLPHNGVTCIAPGPQGRLWVGSNAGFSNFDPHTGRFQNHRHNPADPNSLSEDVVFFIHPAEDGKVLWIGTRNGFNRFDTATGKFTLFRSDPVQPDSLAGNDVRAIAKDRAGSLWIGTRHAGLERFNPRTGVFQHFRHDPANPDSLSGNAVYAVLVDHRGRVWAGTTTGLNRLDPASGNVVRYSERDGLPSETIYGVLEDDGGHIWMSTGLGLARLDPDYGTFRRYDVSHGLQDNEFNGGAAYYSAATHQMYFGGVSGYNRFDPAKVLNSTFRPPVVLTSFQILDKSLPEVIEAGKAELSWHDSMFSIEFAALDYSAPDQNSYAYRLEGFDKDWQYSRHRRLAIYTNLDNGDYVFRVKATNSDGVWSDREVALPITVIPAPWKRWWFLLTAGLLLAGVATWAYRARVARFRGAQAAQEAFSRLLIESQEAERKKIAAELHDSLGQNLIVIRNHALMALSKPDNTEGALGKLQDISDAASGAIEEVREIARNLRPQQLDRLGLRNALNSIVARAASASSIRFNAGIDNIDGLLNKEEEINLYRIVQESVNNILKHSQATEAGVFVERKTSGMTVRIHDNGQGFDTKSHWPDKRGFGLTGIAERARILGARHSVESALGAGTVIFLEIDLRHAKASGDHRG